MPPKSFGISLPMDSFVFHSSRINTSRYQSDQLVLVVWMWQSDEGGLRFFEDNNFWGVILGSSHYAWWGGKVQSLPENYIESVSCIASCASPYPAHPLPFPQRVGAEERGCKHRLPPAIWSAQSLLNRCLAGGLTLTPYSHCFVSLMKDWLPKHIRDFVNSLLTQLEPWRIF